MSAALAHSNAPPPETLTIDISANLLESFFEEKRLQRRRKAQGVLANLAGITVSLLISLGVFTIWIDANADLDGSQQKLVKSESELSAAGLGKEDEVAEDVLRLPAKFATQNFEVLSVLGSTLAATGTDVRLNSLQSSKDKSGGLRLVGQAETRDLGKVREFLDRVQASSPGVQALITTVSQAPGESATNLLVSFEIRAGAQDRSLKMEVKP